MTASKPVVTKLEDIQSLLDVSVPKDAADNSAAPKEQPAANGAALSLATQMREKAESLGQAYFVHRMEGGKRKAFLATLSEEDADFFRVLRIDEVIAESIAEELAAKAKVAKSDGEVFDQLVEDEKAKAIKAKAAKMTKEEKEEKKEKKKSKLAASRLVGNINSELFRVIGRGLN